MGKASFDYLKCLPCVEYYTPPLLFIYCLVCVLEQKESDDFNAKLLAVRLQWRYEVSKRL